MKKYKIIEHRKNICFKPHFLLAGYICSRESSITRSFG